MSELITEYFTCEICQQNYSYSEKDMPTVCNGCWLKMEIWQKYQDPDLRY